MKRWITAGLALASVMVFSHSHLRAASYATSVVDYQPGALSGSLSSYTNAAAALGMPATFNPAFPPWSPEPTPITPFEAPYTADQLAGIGTGGSLTLYFADPIRNSPANPYGRDFVVYGGAALVDVNWPNGLSDGSVFGNLGGVTRISVSADGQNFYLLNPSLAPVTEAALPTDSAGQFGLPPNPSLTPAAFAGKTLPEIRALYGGSAGGVGYDLSWAIDGQGQPVALSEVNYVRLNVLEGQIKLDALAAVPEPSTWLLGLAGVGLLVWARRHQKDLRS
ncbi:PEP-CTERM sorting domain-containing protein [Fontisphaera persica]|uniref:PEP-CTERM sorting domain-containing protein n=1 Tax=Fontisphaera persica TaxID=2974023 RepID=UPI0024C08383|nr:PEP-CTERM sorting domain-containing protein [Fontisphaera persica]WCJ59096.1 PEP-CTERM sorting domain-containing protein [Fontisphaera persica]